MRRLLTAVALAVACVTSHASNCEGPALGAADYDRAVKTVLDLPETRAWSRTHVFPVSVLPANDGRRAMKNGCYWSVTVDANRPERLETWHVFFVQVRGKRMLISDLNGNEVPLDQWRRR
jgi:hypothetical protein